MKHDAPKLRAYLDKHGYLFFSRLDWEENKNSSKDYKTIDVNETPLSSITNNPNFIKALQKQLSQFEYEI